MFLNFIDELRAAGIPASLKEHLVLLEALDKDVIEQTPEAFYYLSRATFVKDEGLLDRFDQVFQKVFKGVMSDYGQQPVDIPEDWLKQLAERYFSAEEMEAVKSLGSWDEIMETLKKRLEEQEKRHQGGNKWIGTNGTSPFGHSGYNPEGVRIGGEGKQGRAIKVWEKREFANLDNTRELGTRNIKVALRRLRRFAREGAAEELDLDATIAGTAKQGWLDVVPVLLIDEIDKADIEFPNDLLAELDRMAFDVYETGEHVAAVERPIVVITSNNEKDLPDAFLRRCFFHYIRFPDRETMEAIVDVHFPGIQKTLVRKAMEIFYELREVPGLKKKPSTSELLDWLKLLMNEDMPLDVLQNRDPGKAIPPLHGALLKNEQDVMMFERLAFMARGGR